MIDNAESTPIVSKPLKSLESRVLKPPRQGVKQLDRQVGLQEGNKINAYTMSMVACCMLELL